jgi:hypothetical protein
MSPESWETRQDHLEQWGACKGSAMAQAYKVGQDIKRDGVGFVNDEHNLTSTFVFCEQGAMQRMGHLCRVMRHLIVAQVSAHHLEDVVQGECGIQDMHGLEVLQIAVGERSVEEDGFPYPCLSEEYHAWLTSFETLNKRLQGSLMAPTRKEPGWMRRV